MVQLRQRFTNAMSGITAANEEPGTRKDGANMDVVDGNGKERLKKIVNC